MTARCRETVSQSPRAMGPVSSNPLSTTPRMSGSSASGGAPAASRSDPAAARSVTRYVELEGPEPKRLGEPESDRSCLVRLGGDRAPGAVELLGAPTLRERLERVHREPPLVRVELGKRCRAAHVGDPGSDVDLSCNIGDRAVGNAQENECRLVVVQPQAALSEPSAHRRADAAARADHMNAVDHWSLQFRGRIPGSRRVAPCCSAAGAS